MGDTSRNVAQSFEEMAEAEEPVVNQSNHKESVVTPKKKVSWFQSILNWWNY